MSILSSTATGASSTLLERNVLKSRGYIREIVGEHGCTEEHYKMYGTKDFVAYVLRDNIWVVKVSVYDPLQISKYNKLLHISVNEGKSLSLPKMFKWEHYRIKYVMGLENLSDLFLFETYWKEQDPTKKEELLEKALNKTKLVEYKTF